MKRLREEEEEEEDEETGIVVSPGCTAASAPPDVNYLCLIPMDVLSHIAHWLSLGDYKNLCRAIYGSWVYVPGGDSLAAYTRLKSGRFEHSARMHELAQLLEARYSGPLVIKPEQPLPEACDYVFSFLYSENCVYCCHGGNNNTPAQSGIAMVYRERDKDGGGAAVYVRDSVLCLCYVCERAMDSNQLSRHNINHRQVGHMLGPVYRSLVNMDAMRVSTRLAAFKGRAALIEGACLVRLLEEAYPPYRNACVDEPEHSLEYFVTREKVRFLAIDGRDSTGDELLLCRFLVSDVTRVLHLSYDLYDRVA